MEVMRAGNVNKEIEAWDWWSCKAAKLTLLSEVVWF